MGTEYNLVTHNMLPGKQTAMEISDIFSALYVHLNIGLGSACYFPVFLLDETKMTSLFDFYLAQVENSHHNYF